MPPSDTAPTSNVSPKGQITVPADIRRALGIKPGGKVRFVRKGEQVSIEAYDEPPISSLFGLLTVPQGQGIRDLDAAIEQAKAERTEDILTKGR